MSDEWATSLIVTHDRHAEFVALSGDSNPLHTDPLAARRLPFGRVAVHGVHLALLALNAVAGRDSRTPTSVRCTFRHQVAPGDEIRIRISRTSATEYDVALEHDVWRVADMSVELGESGAPGASSASFGPPEPADPLNPPIAELSTAGGAIEVRAGIARLHTRVPHALRVLGERGVAELVTLTRLVGMHVPGLHSMFSSFDLAFGDTDEESEGLTYAMRRYDDRFSKATLDVAASTLRGTVVAFVRPSPVAASIGDTSPSPRAFAGQQWLVVGGSRGLGATTALLLGSGGANVRLTYRTGADDARSVASNVDATAYELDVELPDAGIDELTADGWAPSHVAYFASPPIFVGVAGVYSPGLERRFRDVYIDAFEELLDRLDTDRLRGIMWPSSTAVDRDVAGLAEYAVAKRRGEEHCELLRRRHPHIRIETPRFPRLETDQTTSIVPVEAGDAASAVLAALSPFSDGSSSADTLGSWSTP